MRQIKKWLRYIFLICCNLAYKIKWGGALVSCGLLNKRVSTQIIIDKTASMFIGKNVAFQRNVSLSSVDAGKLHIGDNVFFNRNCIVICKEQIVIDNDVIIGPGVTIYDHDHIFTEKGIENGYKTGRVIIGKGSWLGANVTILRDSCIGEGCVIGAGCVVKGSIPPHSLVTGSRELNIVPIKNSEFVGTRE